MRFEKRPIQLARGDDSAGFSIPSLMPREATFIPAESSTLCESCGYTLDGLPDDGNCPECGHAVIQSRGGDGRGAPAWEDTSAQPRSAINRFIATSLAIIFTPRHFYRTLATRGDLKKPLIFARLHWLLSAILIGGALYQHTMWYSELLGWQRPAGMAIWLAPASVTMIYLLLWGTTRVAAWLTAWEAGYRGYRLPKPVVLRGLYYHAAHYLPVGLAAFATTAGYRWAMAHSFLSYRSASVYLVALCIEVLLGAGYLFKVYWTGMRNMMYANA